MDNKVEILLGSKKNLNSVNTDTYTKVELTRNTSELTEFTVNDVVNATEVFEEERQDNPIYRIYGKIEYLSLLNGLIYNYTELADFFTPNYTGASKNITNSFDFYLVRPITGKTSGDNYVRYFEVIATPSDFELYPAGFTNNVYGEQEYAFSFTKDFDVSKYFDMNGVPITELFLYSQYDLKSNGNGVSETMEYSYWDSTGTLSKENFVPKTLYSGDTIETATGGDFGDLMNYNEADFSETQVSGQTVYIKTQYEHNSTPYFLIWKYDPFIPFKLRYLSDELYNANTGTTSYDTLESIPEYATELDDGNYVWREIVEQGYTEPLTGNGVDYPFFNGRRYLFSPIILSVSPDIDDIDNGYNTRNQFNNISFDGSGILNIVPAADDLDNIGKPCQ